MIAEVPPDRLGEYVMAHRLGGDALGTCYSVKHAQTMNTAFARVFSVEMSRDWVALRRTLSALLRLLPERDPHPHLFEALEVILDNLHNPADAGELFIRFELAVLNDLGFGLDLSECAATGTRSDLAYISPKSGRAVSREAGAPWADKMFALPSFLATEKRQAADFDSLAEAFRLTAFFLHRHVYEPRGMEASTAREGFVQAALKALKPAAASKADELSA